MLDKNSRLELSKHHYEIIEGINKIKKRRRMMSCSCCEDKKGDVLEVCRISDGDYCDCCNNSKLIGELMEKDRTLGNLIDNLHQSISEKVDLKIKKLDKRAVIPQYQHEGDAGFDFTAIIDHTDVMGKYSETVTVSPGEKYIVNTGLSMAIPMGYELQVRPRSGLAYKHGITIINSPGTVDSSYRGIVKIILLNTGKNPFEISTGDRIAQGVINKIPTVEIREVDDLDETVRGAGCFGSTGRR